MSFIRTPSDFSEAVNLGVTTESLELEFKKDLDRWRAKSQADRQLGQKEICRDISQFANTRGGCLLVGLEERQIGPSRVADKVCGVDDFDGRRAWIQQAIQNFLVPSTFAIEISRIDFAGETIIAINVPAVEHLVSLWDRHTGTIECFLRTNHGKQALNPDQMEEHLMNSRRASKLALERLVRELPKVDSVDLASGLWTMVRRTSVQPQSIERTFNDDVTIGALGEHEFTLLLPSVAPPQGVQGTPTIRVPYGLIREVWRTAQSRIGIFLDVRIVHFNGRMWLQPF